MAQKTTSVILRGLNQEQRQAVRHGDDPLLIIAGAGSGKTRTIVHRVAHLIDQGSDPSRILLLTFTRRAAGEMHRRVDTLLRRLDASRTGRARLNGRKLNGGTFHGTAARLLRIYGKSVGLNPGFTIHDRSDSEDLLDVVRTELGLANTDKRFPKKGTCMAIYSHSVNSGRPLEDILAHHFPWCEDYEQQLKQLFQGYTDRKEQASVLDYDDLLLFWRGALSDPKVGRRLRDRFDCVLVDEYQDTNRLQAEILQRLRPQGLGLTVVGDDAQSIYSFRAATIQNILDFPRQFPNTCVVKLEQNYRSTQPILAATNAVIAESTQRYAKDLWSRREGGEKPQLVVCEDEDEQAAYVVRQILERFEEGVALQEQAVLFRASHHAMVLEAELARHNIPFVKYGGLKFTEAAHVKDLMAFLRLAENPRDLVSGSRALKLLPGIGPKKAHHLMGVLLEAEGDWRAWQTANVPAATAAHWPKFLRLVKRLTAAKQPTLPSQVSAARKFYAPLLEDKFDNPEPRLRDLEQLEQVAARYCDRRTMLAEIALDPPTNTNEFADDPQLDDDYLVLSTTHSAKGLEWKAVYVINASDGNLPSSKATGDSEQLEEERRLFYVALTRAKDWLHVCFPQRYYHAHRGGNGDPHGYAQLTRFITKQVKPHFQSVAAYTAVAREEWEEPVVSTRKNVRRETRDLWS